MSHPVVFDAASAKRIVRTTRERERSPKTIVNPPAPPRTLAPTKYAKVTQAITAASGTNLGAGRVSLQAVSVNPSGAPSYADLGLPPIPCFSGASTSIAAGRLVIIAVIDNRYHVISDFC